jgi:hypothetical protein
MRTHSASVRGGGAPSRSSRASARNRSGSEAATRWNSPPGASAAFLFARLERVEERVLPHARGQERAVVPQGERRPVGRELELDAARHALRGSVEIRALALDRIRVAGHHQRAHRERGGGPVEQAVADRDRVVPRDRQ